MAVDLADAQAAHVLYYLRARDICRVRNAAKVASLARVAGSEEVWSELMRRLFGLAGHSARAGPLGEDCAGSCFRAFELWHRAMFQDAGLREEELSPEQLPLPSHWLAVWSRMDRWLGRQAPHIRATLRPPAAPDALGAFGEASSPCASSAFGLWAIHDGQQVPLQYPDLLLPVTDDFSPLGLLGGYVCYDHEISIVLLPLRSAAALTALLRERMPHLADAHPHKIAFACSFNLMKLLFVDLRDGGVFAWTRSQALTSMFQRLVPPLQGAAAGGCDLHRWFEEYVRRLEAGVYTAMPLRPFDATPTHGISLFPMEGPELSRCVTRGVEVTASCLLMPEHPQGWTYSIALRLVEPEAQRGFKTCQLVRRTWRIAEEGYEPEIVKGEGVIGIFPILCDGGWWLNDESDPNRQYEGSRGLQTIPFRYQSCTGRIPSMRGSFGGELTFVPGTKRQPEGPAFQAILETFRTFVPDFIY